MPEPRRIVTAPLPLAGGLTRSQLAFLVAADALVRRATAEGRRTQWAPATLSGDLGAQLAVERELARQGSDRQAEGREAFAERVVAHEQQVREELTATLSRVGVAVDLEPGESDDRVARTAFVRLYDAGLIQETERVVEVCPRCTVVVDPTDAEEAEVDATVLTLRLADDLDVDVVAAELLPGATAVVVPVDHPAAGTDVDLPLVGTTVPVVGEEGVERSRLVVPAHDPGDCELARRLGLPAPEVLDEDGVGLVAPIEGLARYAARAAAADLLAAEGVVVDSAETVEALRRCRRCATVLLPRLGRHWFLDVADLELAATDAVREGVPFAPDAARQEFVDWAGRSGWWCLTRRGWAGRPVPVSRCVDCGGTAVGVDLPESCGKCMGVLVADDAVLDPRFVAALSPLAEVGWPDDEVAAVDASEVTTLLVGPPGVRRWALPMAALALRLTGSLPFAAVAVSEVDDAHADAAPVLDDSPDDPAVVRLAVLVGDFDCAAASDLAGVLREPSPGDGDVDEVTAVYEQAFQAGMPGAAIAPLVAAGREGVRAVDRARALAAPLLGE